MPLNFPVLPFLVFLKFLVFSPCEEFLVFLSVFPFFSRDFRGSVGIENPCFFGGFPCLFPKKQGKEGQGFLITIIIRGVESMVIKFHGNVRGEVRVNFLALFASKLYIFMCGALKLSGIVRADVRLNIAIPMLFWSLFLGPATTQNLVVKFDGEICGGVLVENASDDFPQQKKLENLLPNFAGSSPPISPKTSPTSLWKSLVLIFWTLSNVPRGEGNFAATLSRGKFASRHLENDSLRPLLN